MHYAEYAPSPRLRGVVERFWFLETDAGGSADAVLPDGRMELVFHYRGAFRRRTFDGAGPNPASAAPLVKQPAALLVGQMVDPVVLIPAERTAVAGIRLHPAAGRSLLKFPAAEILGRFLDLSLVFPSAATLEERLADAADNLARGALLESWLVGVGCESPQREIAAAVHAIERSGGRTSIERLAVLTGIGVRRLERQFREQVGMPPKTFSRLVRLQRALAAIHEGLALSDVAAACGFYDQAHMTRDFHELAAMSPGVWQAHAGELAPLFVSSSPPLRR